MKESVNDMRIKKIVVVLLTIFLITACVSNKPYIEINYNQFKEKLENDETFIFYIGSTECSFCKRYEKTLKRVVDEYNVDVYYINVASGNLTEDEMKELDNLVNFTGTPLTVFVIDGEIQGKYNRINGAVGSEKIIEAFKRNGFITA